MTTTPKQREPREIVEEIEVTIPGGGKATYKGAQMFCAFLLLFLAGTVYYGFYHMQQTIDGLGVQLASVQQSIAKTDETQKAMIYVLSLPAEEREKLNLARPKLLNDLGR